MHTKKNNTRSSEVCLTDLSVLSFYFCNWKTFLKRSKLNQKSEFVYFNGSLCLGAKWFTTVSSRMSSLFRLLESMYSCRLLVEPDELWILFPTTFENSLPRYFNTLWIISGNSGAYCTIQEFQHYYFLVAGHCIAWFERKENSNLTK